MTLSPKEINFYSATSLGTFDTCPYRWWLNYIKKLKQLPNDAFIIGTAYHKSLELFHSGMDKPMVLEQIKKDFTGIDGIEKFGLVRTMFEKYCESPINLPTVELEYKFNFQDEVTGLRFKGFVDRVIEDGLIEYKTSSFDYKPEHINEIQVALYALAYKVKFGKMPKVYLSVMNKKKAHRDKYEPQLIDLDLKEEDIDKFYLKATTIADKIREGKFNATKGTHCYFCPFGRKGTGNCKYSI